MTGGQCHLRLQSVPDWIQCSLVAHQTNFQLDVHSLFLSLLVCCLQRRQNYFLLFFLFLVKVRESVKGRVCDWRGGERVIGCWVGEVEGCWSVRVAGLFVLGAPREWVLEW